MKQENQYFAYLQDFHFPLAYLWYDDLKRKIGRVNSDKFLTISIICLYCNVAVMLKL